jgi:hypothetical protein
MTTFLLLAGAVRRARSTHTQRKDNNCDGNYGEGYRLRGSSGAYESAVRVNDDEDQSSST